MLRRLESLFDPNQPPRSDSLLGLIISDYLAYYVATPTRSKWGVYGSTRRDSPRKLAFLFLPRLAHNPCLHATLLLRLALRSPKFTLGLWRTLLIAKHSIDIHGDIKIGPGLMLPHPVGITIAPTLRIGSNVTILHQVTIGGVVRQPEGESQLSPIIGDDVVIYTQSILVGPITIGDGAVVGAGSLVDQDVASGAVVPGRAALFRRLASDDATPERLGEATRASGPDAT